MRGSFYTEKGVTGSSSVSTRRKAEGSVPLRITSSPPNSPGAIEANTKVVHGKGRGSVILEDQWWHCPFVNASRLTLHVE